MIALFIPKKRMKDHLLNFCSCDALLQSEIIRLEPQLLQKQKLKKKKHDQHY